MKNKILSYERFISESITIYNKGGLGEIEILPNRILSSTKREDYLRLRYQYWSSLMDLYNFYNVSFSNLAPTLKDPDNDYNEIKSVLSKKGWGMESIKNLFSEKADNLCGYNFFDMVEGRPTKVISDAVKRELSDIKYLEIFTSNKSLSTLSGYIDLYLYKLVEELGLKGGEIFLGGEGWGFYEGGDDNEFLIKCAYGYHETKYGQLFLKSRGISEMELLEKAKKDLFNWLRDYQWISIIGNSDIKFDDYCIEEEDRLVIYVGEISEKANKNVDDIIANIYRYLASFKLDIITSDDKKEVVIYLQHESH